jgi:hypothetical protein
MRIRPARPLFALLTVLMASALLKAQEQPAQAPQKAEFLRFVDDGHGGGKLETALVTYRNDAGVTVHLVAAIHIADKPYYMGLNKTFKGYDALLYEMVKPKGARPPGPGEERSTSMISTIQRFMKDTLDLTFQLDEIDYNAPNFVHADLDAETFQKMEEERGESIWTLMLQQMLKQMANPPADQQEIGLGDLINALTSPDRARQLKLILGRQFGDIEDQMSSFGGTVLITERNKACFRVLDKEIAAGKKNLGIFYGAGHMGDMQKRLLERGFHRTASEWRVGWDLSSDAGQAPAAPEKADPAPRAAPHRHDDDDAPANGVEKVGYFPAAASR